MMNLLFTIVKKSEIIFKCLKDKQLLKYKNFYIKLRSKEQKFKLIFQNHDLLIFP